MTDDDRYLLVGQLQRHEDAAALTERRRVFKPYTDTVGKTTIGWGRNLSDRGISDEEADYLLANDMAAIEDELMRAFPWFVTLDSVRQAAMVNFGMIGLPRLRTFTKALEAMAHGQYGLASDEFYNSNLPKPGQWGPVRTSEVCAMIRTGQWGA